MKNKRRPVSKLAFRSAQKAVRRYSRDAERNQRSMNKVQQEIDKLKSDEKTVNAFLVNRLEADLKVKQNAFERAYFKYEGAFKVLNSHIERDAKSRNNGSE